MPDNAPRSPYEKFFKLRGRLMVPPMLFVLFCTHWEVENHLLAFGLGGLLLAVGLALRLWAQMHLHYRLPDPMALTRTGPFAYVRNPIYIANTTLLVGACIMSEVMVAAPFMLLCCMLVYTLVVRHEEIVLAQKYGQSYLDYCEQVPRWFPRLPAQRVGAQFRSLDFLVPSLKAEAQTLLLAVPFVAKELIH